MIVHVNVHFYKDTLLTFRYQSEVMKIHLFLCLPCSDEHMFSPTLTADLAHSDEAPSTADIPSNDEDTPYPPLMLKLHKSLSPPHD